MPFVPETLLAHVLDALAGWDAAVPGLAAGAEPLCAAYAASCSAPRAGGTRVGERKMTSFWRACASGS